LQSFIIVNLYNKTELLYYVSKLESAALSIFSKLLFSNFSNKAETAT